MESRLLAGRYRLDTLLGRGGMAVVWRALDEQLDREVAVKAVDLTGPDSDRAAERFRKEARTTARLNHPNIVTVFDSGVDERTAYIVMELLSGPTLAAELLEHGPMEFDEVRRIGQQVCAGLAAAHEAGVIHRDIKPGNIAYAADGTVKVLDFGITQLVDEAMGLQSLTAPQTVLGTAEYLSPEQASAMPIDARADLYAFGCVLAALLTGKPPFIGDTSVSVLLQHTQAPLPDFAARRPDMPRGFVDLLQDLLAKDRFDRPRTAKEAQTRLASLSLWPPSEEDPPDLAFPAETPAPPAAGSASASTPEPASQPATEAAQGGTEASGESGAETAESASEARPRSREPWIPPRPQSRVTAGMQQGSTQVLPAPYPGETRAGRAAARSSIRHTLVLWTLAVAVVLVLVIVWLAGRDGSAGASPSSGDPTRAATTTASPPPTTPSSTASSVSVTSPQEALARMRLAVTQARKARQVDARAALVLNRRLDDIAAALRKADDDHDGSQLVNDLAKKINELADQQHITYAGQQLLAGPFATLQAQIPPPSD